MEISQKILRGDLNLGVSSAVLREPYWSKGFHYILPFQLVDPFGGVKPRLLRRGKKAPLRVNPEPLGLSDSTELSTRAQAEGLVEVSG
jgi:hypothetical protein